MPPACISSELGSTAVQFGEKTSPGLRAKLSGLSIACLMKLVRRTPLYMVSSTEHRLLWVWPATAKPAAVAGT